MFMKSLAAAAALATTIVAVPATQADAKTQVDVDIYFGSGYGGWARGHGYGRGGYRPVARPHGMSCHKGENVVRWAGFRNVQPIDCRAPVYHYKARKFGHPYRVRVNPAGNITNVTRL